MIKLVDVNIYSRKKSLLYIEKLSLEENNKYFIFGSNGTGKTLLMRTIVKQYSNFTGDVIYLAGSDKTTTLYISRKIMLNMSENIRDNIFLPIRRNKAVDLKRISGLLGFVLGGLKITDKTSLLSFSQCKAVEIVRAVILVPHLLVIDDFDTMFDDITQIKVLALLNQLQNKGTVIVATGKNPDNRFEKNYLIKNNKLCLI